MYMYVIDCLLASRDELTGQSLFMFIVCTVRELFFEGSTQHKRTFPITYKHGLYGLCSFLETTSTLFTRMFVKSVPRVVRDRLRVWLGAMSRYTGCSKPSKFGAVIFLRKPIYYIKHVARRRYMQSIY